MDYLLFFICLIFTFDFEKNYFFAKIPLEEKGLTHIVQINIKQITWQYHKFNLLFEGNNIQPWSVIVK